MQLSYSVSFIAFAASHLIIDAAPHAPAWRRGASVRDDTSDSTDTGDTQFFVNNNLAGLPSGVLPDAPPGQQDPSFNSTVGTVDPSAPSDDSITGDDDDSASDGIPFFRQRVGHKPGSRSTAS